MREQIAAEALSWCGTPYKHMGNKKGVAADCGMLLINVFSAVGAIDYFDPGEYPKDWMMHRSEERYLKTVESYAEKTTEPLQGNIALFKFGRCISHGGIITEWPKIVHAYLPCGIVIEEDISTNPNLFERLVGFWDLKNGRQ